MIDLNRIGGGRKLINKLLKLSKLTNHNYTKKKQDEQLSKHKNIHSPLSRNK